MLGLEGWVGIGVGIGVLWVRMRRRREVGGGRWEPGKEGAGGATVV